jgi:hypothetical protein
MGKLACGQGDNGRDQLTIPLETQWWPDKAHHLPSDVAPSPSPSISALPLPSPEPSGSPSPGPSVSPSPSPNPIASISPRPLPIRRGSLTQIPAGAVRCVLPPSCFFHTKLDINQCK